MNKPWKLLYDLPIYEAKLPIGGAQIDIETSNTNFQTANVHLSLGCVRINLTALEAIALGAVLVDAGKHHQAAVRAAERAANEVVA